MTTTDTKEVEEVKFDRHYESNIKDCQAGLKKILSLVRDQTWRFDGLQLTNLKKMLQEKKAKRDSNILQIGQKRYKNEELDAEVAEYEAMTKQKPSAILEEHIKKVRERLKRRDGSRYTEFQVSQMHRYLDPAGGKIASLGFPMLDGPIPREQRMGAQVIWNAIITAQKIGEGPKKAPQKIPTTWALAWDDPRKTDQQGNPFYAEYDEQGFVIEGFDKSALSQTESAVNARKKMRERQLPKDYFGEPLELAPIKSAKTLEKQSERRLKEKEQQRKERKKHFSEVAESRAGASP